MKKRLFLLMAALLLCCTLSAAYAEDAVSGTCGTRLNWVLENSTLTISGTGAMRNYTESTPAPWDGVKANINTVVIDAPITKLGDYAFSGCASLKQVTLPDSLITVGLYAFNGCASLKSVILPKDVVIISNYAFQDCFTLEDINFPENLIQIGICSFANTAIKILSLPDSMSTLSGSAFEGCKQLASVHIPGSVTLVPDAFRNCTALKEVILDSGVDRIGPSAFNHCSSLTSIHLPNTVVAINDSAFDECSLLKTVNFSGTTTEARAITIGASNQPLTHATWHCSDDTLNGVSISSGSCGLRVTWQLDSDGTLTISGTGSMYNYTGSSIPWGSEKASIKKIVVQTGVLNVGAYAFSDCTNLQTVQLSDTIQTIGEHAFWACPQLTDLKFSSNLSTIEPAAFEDCTKLSTVEFPQSLQEIGSYAFSCTAIEKIVLPYSISTVYHHAFDSCKNLIEANIPGSLLSISSNLFENCTSLRTVTLGEGIEIIEERAFSNNLNLHEIHLPSSLTHIKMSAFISCESLSDIYYNDTIYRSGRILNGTSSSDHWNMNYNLSSSVWHCTDGDTTDVVTTWGDNGEGVLWDLQDNTLLIYGHGIIADVGVDDWTYYVPWGRVADRCQTVIIDSGILQVGLNSFEHCYHLQTIVIREGLDVIGAWIPYSVQTLYLPKSVKSIASNAATQWSSLTDIYYAGSQQDAQRISIGSDNSPITSATWHYGVDPLPPTDPSLTTLTLPAHLTTIAAEAFSGISAQKIVVPDGVTAIGSKAFASCPQLVYLQLPAGVLTLAEDMLTGCEGVTIVCQSGSPAHQWALAHGIPVWLN